MQPPAWESRRTSFGRGAAAYDRYRPGYPTAALEFILGTAPRRVLDVGAGTGRLGVLAAALGHDVVAVEPDPAMRAVAEAELPGRVLDGTAEHLPLADASVGAAVVGQAFHWFDPALALPELARVVTPGGVLGVMWNARDDREPWMAELDALIGGEDRLGTRPPPVLDLGEWFPDVRTAEFAHAQEVDVQGLVGLVSSFSYVALRDDSEDVLAQVRRLAATHPDLAGRERFAVPYVTRAFRAVRVEVGPGG